METEREEDPRPGPFIVLTGPTAVGKTALSIRAAESLGGEIVSCDSRQIYRQLQLGTAKPSVQETDAAPHHFVDELDLEESWSAGRFALTANARIASILARGRVPVIVGGSTLYLEALLHGLPDVPSGDPELRETLTAQATTPDGLQALYDELARVDPEGAAQIDTSRRQHVVRAVEVHRVSGKPWSSYSGSIVPPPYRYRVTVLSRPRAELYNRIESRVETMLQSGLVEEVEALMGSGYRFDVSPLRTIGYQEPAAFLSGETDYEYMVSTLKRNSRRYAKRQLTWLRRRSYDWLGLSADSDLDSVLRHILMQ